MVQGMAEILSHPKHAMRQINSKQFRVRYANGYQTWLGVIQKKGPSTGQTGLHGVGKWISEVSLIGGDKVVSLVMAHIKYKSVMRAGGTEEVAFTEAWNLVNYTQSSGRKDQIGNLAREPGLEIFSFMQQQPTRAQEFRLTAMRDFANRPSLATAEAVLRAELVTRLAQVAFLMVDALWLTWLGNDADKRDKAWRRIQREFISGPFGARGAILMNLVWAPLRTVGNWMGNDDPDKPQDIVLPWATAAAYINRFQEATLKVWESGDWSSENVIILASLYAKGIHNFVGPKVPIVHVIDMIKTWQGVTKESIAPKKKLTSSRHTKAPNDDDDNKD